MVETRKSLTFLRTRCYFSRHTITSWQLGSSWIEFGTIYNILDPRYPFKNLKLRFNFNLPFPAFCKYKSESPSFWSEIRSAAVFGRGMKSSVSLPRRSLRRVMEQMSGNFCSRLIVRIRGEKAFSGRSFENARSSSEARTPFHSSWEDPRSGAETAGSSTAITVCLYTWNRLVSTVRLSWQVTLIAADWIRGGGTWPFSRLCVTFREEQSFLGSLVLFELSSEHRKQRWNRGNIGTLTMFHKIIVDFNLWMWQWTSATYLMLLWNKLITKKSPN